MLAIFLEIGSGPPREESAPGSLKRGARSRKTFRRAGGAFAGLAARIEAAAPVPRVGAGRVAGPPADRANVHVAIIEDQPGLVVGSSIAAACEDGHQRNIGVPADDIPAQ